MKTVAGTPDSRDNTGARAPLLSHATARPRQAGTSFESQAQQRAGSGYESQTCRDLSTLRARLTAIPARPRNAYKQVGRISRWWRLRSHHGEQQPSVPAAGARGRR